MALDRRRWLQTVTAMAAAPLLGAAAMDKPKVIKIVAQRFRYTPNQITLRAGQEYVLECTALDFVHGFNLPDLKKRVDLPPGIVTKVNVKFDQPGKYDFLCDNFCGDGHEEMNGRFIVKA